MSSSDFLSGTDIVVIRRVQTSPVAASVDIVANDIYLQAVGRSGDIQVGVAGANPVTQTASKTTATLLTKTGFAAPIYKFNTQIYFVSPCSNRLCGSGGDGVPSLKRLEMVAGPNFRIQTVAEGVESLRIMYGVDTSNAPTNPITGQIGDGVPDVFVDDPAVDAAVTYPTTGVAKTGLSGSKEDKLGMIREALNVVLDFGNPTNQALLTDEQIKYLYCGISYPEDLKGGLYGWPGSQYVLNSCNGKIKENIDKTTVINIYSPYPTRGKLLEKIAAIITERIAGVDIGVEQFTTAANSTPGSYIKFPILPMSGTSTTGNLSALLAEINGQLISKTKGGVCTTTTTPCPSPLPSG